MSIERAIANAAASVEMEGYSINEQSKKWCEMLLRKEISMDDYISLIKQQAGITA